jgi:hypothetical protein
MQNRQINEIAAEIKSEQIIFQFVGLCGNYFIDEHLALENPKIRKQLAIKEPIEEKMKKLETILENDF